MTEVNVELIRKLHLRKGHKYILFFDKRFNTMEAMSQLAKILKDQGEECLVVVGLGTKTIKIVEEEK